MDDTISALLRKSFKWVFNKGFPILSHSLLLMKGNLKGKKGEKSGNLNSLSKLKSCTIPYVQSDGLSFYQNAIPKVREVES